MSGSGLQARCSVLYMLTPRSHLLSPLITFHYKSSVRQPATCRTIPSRLPGGGKGGREPAEDTSLQNSQSTARIGEFRTRKNNDSAELQYRHTARYLLNVPGTPGRAPPQQSGRRANLVRS